MMSDMSDSDFFRSVIQEGTPQPSLDATPMMLFGDQSAVDPLRQAEEQAPVRVLERLAGSPECDQAAIERFASHEDMRVRRAVAANPNLTEALMWKLAGDDDHGVRLRLAGNSQVNEFVLESLAEDKHPAVAARAERTLAKSPVIELGKAIHWLFRGELKKTG